MNRITKLTVLGCIFSAGLLIVLSSCRKYETQGRMAVPGIALTFDDGYVDDWYKCLNLFDSFHVKATFYITRYAELSADQKKKLKEIQAHGHEIAFHSTNHPDFSKFAHNNGISRLIKEEIEKGLEDMHRDGYYPTTFAYPYGSHTAELDQCLLRRFKSVRVLNGTKNYSKSFTATSDNSILYAMGMDRSAGKTNEELINLVNLAKTNNNCLVLVGHHVQQKNTKMEVPYNRLKRIITTASQLNMTFYTVSEISRP
jgi:peptidoglycan/xylan/chitin deacetylase (PgdA/CDA1 family)